MEKENAGDGEHVSFAFVESHLDPSGMLEANLAEGETAWNPASTKRPVHGPAHLTYFRYVDGGWHLTVNDPK